MRCFSEGGLGRTKRINKTHLAMSVRLAPLGQSNQGGKREDVESGLGTTSTEMDHHQNNSLPTTSQAMGDSGTSSRRRGGVKARSETGLGWTALRLEKGHSLESAHDLVAFWDRISLGAFSRTKKIGCIKHVALQFPYVGALPGVVGGIHYVGASYSTWAPPIRTSPDLFSF